MHRLYVERNMAWSLAGLHTGRYHRLYVLKDGECVVVSNLGGCGGGTTELETSLSTVATMLPLKAETNTVTDLSGIITLKAEQTALAVLPASNINNQANSVLASASGVLQHQCTQLPLRMATDSTSNPVQLQIGEVRQLAAPCDLKLHHTH